MTRDHEKSSGNVFADLGFPHSEQELVKAKLTVQIYRLLKDQRANPSRSRETAGHHTVPSLSAHALPSRVGIRRPFDRVSNDPWAGCRSYG